MSSEPSPSSREVKSTDATVSVAGPVKQPSGTGARMGAFGSGLDATPAPPSVSQVGPTGLGTVGGHPAGGSAFDVPPQAPPPEVDKSDLPPGTRIGKCKIVSQLGKGGMGAVYRAHHSSLDIEVALKVITFTPASAQEREEGVQRFVREARAAAKVRHENVIQIFDVDSEGGLHFMLMELVDGASARKLGESGALSLGEGVRIVRDAARALASAHRASIVHRDVKPENILLSRDGRVKVTDFGIAHVQASDSKLTRTGQIIGTPHYMSPEQIDGDPLDGRADIYALGASLFHLVTGTTPFSGPTALQVCMKHLSAPVPSARERNPAVPAELAAVIAKAMAKEPAGRWATADAFADALEPFAGPRRPLGETFPAEATKGAIVTPAGGLAASPEGATLKTPPTLAGPPHPGAFEPGPPAPAPATPPPPPPPPAPPPRGGLGVGGLIGAMLAGAIAVAVVMKAPWAGAPTGAGAGGSASASTSTSTSTSASPGGSEAAGAGKSAAASAPTSAGSSSGGAFQPNVYSPERAQAIMSAAKASSAASELLSQGQIDAAVAAFDGLADEAVRSRDDTLKQVAGMGLFQAGMALDTAGRKKEALARFERLASDFQEMDGTLRKTVAESVARLRAVASADERPIEVAMLRALDHAGDRVVAGDLDGDGRPDLALLGSSGAFFVSRGQAPGQLGERRAWPVDGEGAPDSYVPCRGLLPLAAPARGAAWIALPARAGPASRALQVWTADANGVAHEGPPIDLGPRPASGAQDPEELLAADLDGDGRPDLVGFREEDRALWLLHASSAGGFDAARVLELPGRLERLALGDVTGDRRTDVVAIVNTEARRGPPMQLVVYSFDAEMKQQPVDRPAPFEASWPQLVVGDWSGDGVADIAMTALPKDGGDRALLLLKARGKGFFDAAPARLSLGFVPWGGLLVDVDRDGKADLCVLERTGKDTTLYALLSKGDGAFAASAKHALVNVDDARALWPVDLDGDGKLDLAVYDWGKAVGVVFGDGTGRFGNKE